MGSESLTAVYSDDLVGFIRCLDLPGAEPTMVYLHGLAMASVPSFNDPRENHLGPTCP